MQDYKTNEIILVSDLVNDSETTAALKPLLEAAFTTQVREYSLAQFDVLQLNQQTPTLVLLCYPIDEAKLDHFIKMARHYRISFALYQAPNDESLAFWSLNKGIEGYFTCDDTLDVFVRGIKALNEGQLWFSRCVTCKYIRHQLKINQPNLPQMDTSTMCGLSRRELQVLRLLIQAKTNQAIADQLFVSVPTVKSHVSSILKKTQYKSRSEVAVWARGLSLAEMD